MKRTQIMIIFVAVVFASVCWAQNNGSLHANSSETTMVMGPAPSTITIATVDTETPDATSEATTHSAPKTTAADMTSIVAKITTTPSQSITTVATASPHFVTAESTPADHKDSTYVPSTSVPPSPCGGFDGASFIGGIVLALGVIVILVIIVKCYNHQSNKNELHYSQF